MTYHTEVLVVGATAAGVAAAVAAARAGAHVTLLEAGQHVGGMISGGLGYTDVGDVRVLGGMAAEFRRDVAEFYGVPVGHYAGPEPHAAESILTASLERAGVDVRLGHTVASVTMTGGVATGVVLLDGASIGAGVIVDATYEGDVLALAGATTAVGREGRGLYGESLAGRREPRPGRHSMPWGVSPFVDPGASDGPLIAQLAPDRLEDVGVGDGNVMSYGYRLCLSTAKDRIPFSEPGGYDPAYWELGRRYLAVGGAREPAGRWLGLEQNLPGGKCDANSLGPVSLSVLDTSARGWARGDAREREVIRAHHEAHARSFLWFLASDPEVPQGIRHEMGRWGFSPDEFADTDHVPHQLYVREARRLVGETVLTQADLCGGAMPSDTVAIGSYHLDIREVQRSRVVAWEHPEPEHHVVNEGYLSVTVPPYGIPYRVLLPKRDEVRGLLAAVCVSASHVAFSSIRMEPQYQMLGQAAGTAAALAVRTGVEVHDVDVAILRERLAAAGAVLSLPGR